MAKILVVAETQQNKLTKADKASLTVAKKIAEGITDSYSIAYLGKNLDSSADIQKFGAQTVYMLTNSELETYLSEIHCKALKSLIDSKGFEYIIAPATARGKDYMPRLSAMLNAGLAPNIIGVNNDNNTITFNRPAWAGDIIAKVQLTTTKKLITVQPTGFDPLEALSTESLSESFHPAQLSSKVHFVKAVPIVSERPQLTDASIVISGGRGTKGDFTLIDTLADLLHAAVGATRAVVDAGWQPNDMQVGQTGKTVAPNLYFAFGISGAIQHVAGMKGSKTIVAVNKDPEAPIFSVADYGIVGDLFTVIPQIIEEIKKIRNL